MGGEREREEEGEAGAFLEKQLCIFSLVGLSSKDTHGDFHADPNGIQTGVGGGGGGWRGVRCC